MAEYSRADKLLHRLALQAPFVTEMTFDIDQAISRPKTDRVRDGRHVFVSGLARAGTTILMRRIYATGDFVSLTYRNMPFVLAPNLWGRISNGPKGKGEATERAHGDGILVDVDSPESLDEVFWRIHDGSAYIRDDALVPHAPDEAVRAQFVAYVAAILKSDRTGRSRYLSKNNNSILRLNSIREAFPNAVILIPFRDPVRHAQSLQRQHENFTTQQAQDPFVLSYMTWLGHHEFGLEHRPFRFDSAGADELATRDPATLAYWVELWRQTYGWLERAAPKDAVFVCYEDLCENPAVWSALAKSIDVTESDAGDEPFFAATKPAQDADLDPGLRQQTDELYSRLRARGRDAD